MESFPNSNKVDLLTKFSCCVNILPFLGIFKEVKYIMQILGRSTNAFGKENSSILKLEKCLKFRNRMTPNNIHCRNKCDFDIFLINQRYKKFMIELRIASKEMMISFIKFLDKVEDIFDLQFYYSYVYYNAVESGDFENLINYVKKRVPDIPVPFTDGFDDPRLRKNKNSIFHFLHSMVIGVEGSYFYRYSWNLCIHSQNAMKNLLNSTDQRWDHLNFDNEGGKLLEDLDISERIFLSNGVNFITLGSLKHPLEVKPSEIFKKVTDWKGSDDKGSDKLPFFEPKKFAVSYNKGDIEEFEESLKLIKAKNKCNQKIDEGKRSDLGKTEKIDLIFSENIIKQGIELTKSDGFMFYNSPTCSYCLSFDKMVVKIGKAKSKIYHADESLYIFGFPIFMTLENVDIVSIDHRAYQKFKDLISNINNNNSNLKSMSFYAIFNNNYERIELFDNVGKILPSFRNVGSVYIITQELSTQTVKLIERISNGGVEFTPKLGEKKPTVKLNDPCQFMSKIFLKSSLVNKNQLKKIGNKMAKLPIFSLECFYSILNKESELDCYNEFIIQMLKNSSFKQLKINGNHYGCLTTEEKEWMIDHFLITNFYKFESKVKNPSNCLLVE